MEFDDWAKGYFGENVIAAEACRDAWNAGREPLKALLRELAEWPKVRDLLTLWKPELQERICDALGVRYGQR